MRQLWDNISVRHHHKKREDKDWKYNYRWLDNFLLDSLRNISEEFEIFTNSDCVPKPGFRMSSVTRWPNYLFNMRPLASMKNLHYSIKFSQILLNQPWKDQRL